MTRIDGVLNDQGWQEMLIDYVPLIYGAKEEGLTEEETQQKVKKEIDYLVESIKRCTREIFYDKIRSHKNYINISVTQCMTIASLFIAAKVILEYDWTSPTESWWMEKATEFDNNSCSIKQLKQMEMDLLKTTDWRTCYEVQKRLGEGNIPHGPGLLKRDSLSFAPQVSRLKLSNILSPEQLQKHQQRYDIVAGIAPKGWKKMPSRRSPLGGQYYFNPTTKVTTWTNPLSKGNWKQTAPQKWTKNTSVKVSQQNETGATARRSHLEHAIKAEEKEAARQKALAEEMAAAWAEGLAAGQASRRRAEEHHRKKRELSQQQAAAQPPRPPSSSVGTTSKNGGRRRSQNRTRRCRKNKSRGGTKTIRDTSTTDIVSYNPKMHPLSPPRIPLPRIMKRGASMPALINRGQDIERERAWNIDLEQVSQDAEACSFVFGPDLLTSVKLRRSSPEERGEFLRRFMRIRGVEYDTPQVRQDFIVFANNCLGIDGGNLPRMGGIMGGKKKKRRHKKTRNKRKNKYI